MARQAEASTIKRRKPGRSTQTRMLGHDGRLANQHSSSRVTYQSGTHRHSQGAARAPHCRGTPWPRPPGLCSTTRTCTGYTYSARCLPWKRRSNSRQALVSFGPPADLLALVPNNLPHSPPRVVIGTCTGHHRVHVATCDHGPETLLSPHNLPTCLLALMCRIAWTGVLVLVLPGATSVPVQCQEHCVGAACTTTAR